jgi:hypothetical protein
MRAVFLLTLFLIPFLSKGQTRTITGKVIDENLETLPGVRVGYRDTAQLTVTDLKGNFKIELPLEEEVLVLSMIGMEWTSIHVPSNCDHLEVILLADGIYHYKSHRKIDRLRKKEFDKLPQLHAAAVSKGPFVHHAPCFTREFHPHKPRLDQIRKQIVVKGRQIKASFEELEIGDTIRIPYSGSFRSDGTDRTTLSVWSFTTDKDQFECVIEGIILEKNRRNRGYNIVYKVTSTNWCKYDSIVYNSKNLVVGEVFEHNMKYFKVLTN